MKLAEIIKNTEVKTLINTENKDKIEVSGLSYNSRTTKQGDIFICLVGEHTDGHDYAFQAQEKGASAVVCERIIDGIELPTLIVKNSQIALAQVSAAFYNFPSQKINLIGVTGTNGKTTVTHLIQLILEEAEIKCGLIGTLGNKISAGEGYLSTEHTTPQSPELQEFLSCLADKDIKHAVMEVSSHSLEQYRIGEVDFDCAVFTNLTQDHLDYHITMDKYFEAKSKLFTSLNNAKTGNKLAVINADDDYAIRFIDKVPDGVKILLYGIENKADFVAKNIKYSAKGASFVCATPQGDREVNLKMTGQFSVYNALAALAAGVGYGISIDKCIETLENAGGVAGRFETVITEPLVIVDYAHTPDGLSNVLNAARRIVPAEGKLICLFGCGGDRDATKRPKMGSIAENLADKVIITSDNPRSEDPQQIITDILSGIKSLNSQKITVESDRQRAIELAVKAAGKNDIIVLAGKGHENYQILKDKTIHFDDKEEALKAYEKAKSART